MNRLSYIDWLRGLACLLMFQTHCYDAWLAPGERQSTLLRWSQLLGTFPAPLFLFLLGISFALVTTKLRGKGIDRAQIARTTAKRGAEIFGLALLFRLQEFLLGQPHAPWTDLLRVDILNLMGLSLIVLSAACYFTPSNRGSVMASFAGMFAIILPTPLLWTTWRLPGLPWPIESYLNGVHIFAQPQPWLFPIFPWMAFAFAGAASGFILFSAAAQKPKSTAEAQSSQSHSEVSPRSSVSLWQHLPLLLGFTGGAIAALAYYLDSLPFHLYPAAIYDFWHTSPNFFLIRLGLVMILLTAAYAWCQWGWGARGWSPVIELGKESLIVYWVHIQFVYGGLSILQKGAQSQRGATLGLLIITASMVLLAFAKRKFAEHKRSLTATK